MHKIYLALLFWFMFYNVVLLELEWSTQLAAGSFVIPIEVAVGALMSKHYSEAIEVAVGALVRSSKFDYESIYHV
ncbi:hypothetical protein Peur_030385 [Populus x canadensis]